MRMRVRKLTLILTLSPNAPAALEALIQMGVVHDLAAAENPKTAKELASSCGGDEQMINRSARSLTLGVIHRQLMSTGSNTPPAHLLTYLGT
jgi:predicted transcriptional regulator